MNRDEQDSPDLFEAEVTISRGSSGISFSDSNGMPSRIPIRSGRRAGITQSSVLREIFHHWKYLLRRYCGLRFVNCGKQNVLILLGSDVGSAAEVAASIVCRIEFHAKEMRS